MASPKKTPAAKGIIVLQANKDSTSALKAPSRQNVLVEGVYDPNMTYSIVDDYRGEITVDALSLCKTLAGDKPDDALQITLLCPTERSPRGGLQSVPMMCESGGGKTTSVIQKTPQAVLVGERDAGPAWGRSVLHVLRNRGFNRIQATVRIIPESTLGICARTDDKTSVVAVYRVDSSVDYVAEGLLKELQDIHSRLNNKAAVGGNRRRGGSFVPSSMNPVAINASLIALRVIQDDKDALVWNATTLDADGKEISVAESGVYGMLDLMIGQCLTKISQGYQVPLFVERIYPAVHSSDPNAQKTTETMMAAAAMPEGLEILPFECRPGVMVKTLEEIGLAWRAELKKALDAHNEASKSNKRKDFTAPGVVGSIHDPLAVMAYLSYDEPETKNGLKPIRITIELPFVRPKDLFSEDGDAAPKFGTSVTMVLDEGDYPDDIVMNSGLVQSTANIGDLRELLDEEFAEGAIDAIAMPMLINI